MSRRDSFDYCVRVDFVRTLSSSLPVPFRAEFASVDRYPVFYTVVVDPRHFTYTHSQVIENMKQVEDVYALRPPDPLEPRTWVADGADQFVNVLLNTYDLEIRREEDRDPKTAALDDETFHYLRDILPNVVRYHPPVRKCVLLGAAILEYERSRGRTERKDAETKSVTQSQELMGHFP